MVVLFAVLYLSKLSLVEMESTKWRRLSSIYGGGERIQVGSTLVSSLCPFLLLYTLTNGGNGLCAIYLVVTCVCVLTAIWSLSHDMCVSCHVMLTWSHRHTLCTYHVIPKCTFFFLPVRNEFEMESRSFRRASREPPKRGWTVSLRPFLPPLWIRERYTHLSIICVCMCTYIFGVCV